MNGAEYSIYLMYLKESNISLIFPQYTITKTCNSADATWSGQADASVNVAQQYNVILFTNKPDYFTFPMPKYN